MGEGVKIEQIEKSLKEQVKNLLASYSEITLEEKISEESIKEGKYYDNTRINKSENSSFSAYTVPVSKEPDSKIHTENEKMGNSATFKDFSEVEKFLENQFSNIKIVKVEKDTIFYTKQ